VLISFLIEASTLLPTRLQQTDLITDQETVPAVVLW